MQSEAEAATAPANLVLEKTGFQTQERQYLELWSKGDWTYRIRLVAGAGRQVVDERNTRRRAPPAKADPLAPPVQPAATTALAASGLVQPSDGITPQATEATNSTVRVPRNIRVLLTNGIVDYVTMTYYVRCVLPSEWIANWGSYTGGSNSLNAGAIAARCYAIAKLNAVSGTSTYDICATPSCQVYNPAKINVTYADPAVYYTENWVVLSAAGAVPSTEYSAENNSLGCSVPADCSCGDGWSQPTGGCIFDPVCTGESRYGHGRGMCQWGTARWATGRKMANRTSSDATPNGYPRRDWKWIVQHYSPTDTLVEGAPLLIGDDVRAMDTVNVNRCADGGITNGVNCPLLAALPADNGVPPLGDTKTFTVNVLARPAVHSVSVTTSNATLAWSAIAGTTYRVQFKNDLSDTQWTSLAPDVTASGPTATITDAPAVSQRFYRILVVN